MRWINNMEDNGQLADSGNHFSKQGKVLQPQNTINDEPYAANGQSVAGYIIIYAKDMEEATSIASKCPILNGENTSLEIRETALPR
ncbi:MAG: transcription initiation protein [Ferruginibacter sp.]